jgi:hypothetical protein
MWGTIKCAGLTFGKQEECHLDLGGEETGLLFLAKNWRSGGWLKPNSNNDQIFSSASNNILDKSGIVYFRAISEQFFVRVLS